MGRLLWDSFEREGRITARLCNTSTTAGIDLLEELSVVSLVHGIDVEAGHLPVGSLGAIVCVHNNGEAYEVEFAEPFAAVVTLLRGDTEPNGEGP